MATGTVILATLIRGKTWKELHEGAYVEFKRNVPMEVEEELAERLEELVETIGVDGATDVIEVDRFRIERDQQPLAVAQQDDKRRRLRLVSEDVPLRPRRAPILKAPPKGFKRTTAKA